MPQTHDTKRHDTKRRDSKRRLLRKGESIRKDGKYQYKYQLNGKPKFVYSWRLEPTDPLPPGKKPCLSLRELERQINHDLDAHLDPSGKNMTVLQLVERYLETRTGVKPSTLMGYRTVVKLLSGKLPSAEKRRSESNGSEQGREQDTGLSVPAAFGAKHIGDIKTSDAKIFLIRLQSGGQNGGQNGQSSGSGSGQGYGYSTVKTVRGVLRPAFQMAVDDDVLSKNPFNFELAGVVVNDSVTRQAIPRDQMRKFLKFVHDDNCYCKYYEAVYILFHTGMRISEFCGLTVSDLDMEKRIINIDHQLQRYSYKDGAPQDSTDTERYRYKTQYYITTTKTSSGKRKIPMTEDVYQCFQAILEDRVVPTLSAASGAVTPVERVIDGYTGFLYVDENGYPEVAMHWQHRFKHMVDRYNRTYIEQMPTITPHVCRHTYCSNMAKAGMNPKTLQYLMGHSDIGVTMNTYTHLGLEDAAAEMARLGEVEAARREVESTVLGQEDKSRIS